MAPRGVSWVILVAMNTATRTWPPGEGEHANARHHARLVFVASASSLQLTSSCHDLDGIDEVRLCRGERGIDRTGRVLTLWIPDDRMSGEHCRLLRQAHGWLLDDLHSKNGCILDGALVKQGTLRDRGVLELGHSFFVFRQISRTEPVESGPVDLDAATLTDVPMGLATFSPSLAGELATLARLAGSSVPILLQGETGTGKDVVARAIHALSQRAGDLIAVNCGALPATLIESELFGQRRGAFTDAIDRVGLIRSAHQGTLFLDEIGELPLPAQTTLLRVLEDHQVTPIGQERPIAVDFRMIAATLRLLETDVKASRFRADLHARIAGHTVVLPRLIDRREDLGLLVRSILRSASGDRIGAMSAAAWRAVMRHDWPYNIRELKQALANAVALATSNVVKLEHLPRALREQETAPANAGPAPSAELDATARALRERLVVLLEAHDGNVVKVAKALGKQRSQIYKWCQRLGIELSQFRRE